MSVKYTGGELAHGSYGTDERWLATVEGPGWEAAYVVRWSSTGDGHATMLSLSMEPSGRAPTERDLSSAARQAEWHRSYQDYLAACREYRGRD